MFEELTKTMDGFITDFGIPFYDCIVMKDGECVYRHANGYTGYQFGTRINIIKFLAVHRYFFYRDLCCRFAIIRKRIV